MTSSPIQTQTNEGARILVGTSGYYYADWKGPFYPRDLKKEDYLNYYARFFPAVEINATYYGMPKAKNIQRMVEDSKGKIQFVFKLLGDFTHQRELHAETCGTFSAALNPARERGVLGAVLAQFPYSFHNTKQNREFLHALKDRFPEENLVIELRNRQWVNQDTFSLLKTLDFGFCCVDEPDLKGLMPPVAVATSDTAYLRFHGRNSAKWFEHQRPEERYDYRYSEQEMAEWVPKIKKLAQISKRAYCFANNHFQAKAIESAQLLLRLLGE